MARGKPRGSSKVAKPIKGSKPKPHDGSVDHAGCALKTGQGAQSNARVSEGDISGCGGGKRGMR